MTSDDYLLYEACRLRSIELFGQGNEEDGATLARMANDAIARHNQALDLERAKTDLLTSLEKIERRAANLRHDEGLTVAQSLWQVRDMARAALAKWGPSQ